MVQVLGLSREWEVRWDEFVTTHPAGLLYHSLRFRSLVTDLLGCRADYALAVRDGTVTGVMPLLASEGRYGTVLNSLAYFGSPGGVLAADDEARAALTAWYEEQLATPNVAAGTVVENPFDDAPPVAHDVTDARVCHVTALSPNGTLDAIEPSARRNVAKALRAGIEVSVENDALDSLAAIHRRGMAAIGGRAKSDAFFAAVPQHFRAGTDYELYVARLDGRVVAGLLLFHFGETVEYYVPASDLEHRALQPLSAILARAMADAADRGARSWNWGGSWLRQESLMRFKKKWGGQPLRYSYWTKINTAAIAQATPEALLEAYPGFYVRPFQADEVVPAAAA
jgi:GNAT acetyltransferase-like protein